MIRGIWRSARDWLKAAGQECQAKECWCLIAGAAFILFGPREKV